MLTVAIKPNLFCGNGFTYIINYDGNVVSFGNNESGNLGFELCDIVFPPKQITSLCNIQYISFGYDHTLFLNNNNEVYSMGVNTFGQLGIEKTSEELKFTNYPLKLNLPAIKYISCGDDFSFCLSNDGYMYSFGNNEYGQLGIGNTINQHIPNKIKNIKNIKIVSCGGEHAFCITEDCIIYSWGNNERGQLASGDTSNTSIPIIRNINISDSIISLQCGAYHSIILTNTGYVYICGTNEFGELGIGNSSIPYLSKFTLLSDLPEIKRLESGDTHCLFIDIDDNLWLHGDNEFGQLGVGDKITRYKPFLHKHIGKIQDISQRGSHTYIKNINNEIYSFGYNGRYQIGIETTEECQLKPIQVFKGKEDIWYTNNTKSKAKSARK